MNRGHKEDLFYAKKSPYQKYICTRIFGFGSLLSIT